MSAQLEKGGDSTGRPLVIDKNDNIKSFVRRVHESPEAYLQSLRIAGLALSGVSTSDVRDERVEERLLISE